MANNKKGTRLTPNAFDVFIILLALLLICTTVYRLIGGFDIGNVDRGDEYIVEFECEEEYNSLAKYIESGDNVYIMSTGELLGSIYTDDSKGESLPIWQYRENVDIVIEDQTVPAEGESNGGILNTEKEEDYYKTTLRGKLLLSDKAKPNNNEVYFSIEDFNLTKGSKLSVYTDDTIFTIEVLNITKLDK